MNFDTEEVPVQALKTIIMISTKIRKVILDGDIATANLYLNEPYTLTGTVIQGKKLGRQLGFPTANLHIAEVHKPIPKNGVYVVKSILNNQEYFGMMNIGFRPTVGGTEKTVEVHFFDFKGNLYDKKIKIGILHRLRKEYKFHSIEALQEQLEKDRVHSLQLIAT
ncbi:MAG: riboflavin kinase [Bacteroidota bacterium]